MYIGNLREDDLDICQSDTQIKNLLGQYLESGPNKLDKLRMYYIG